LIFIVKINDFQRKLSKISKILKNPNLSNFSELVLEAQEELEALLGHFQ
tara:strand:- start:140 stop:286 length:147 start_codon:yes stop_codon:yes gene_type:complete